MRDVIDVWLCSLGDAADARAAARAKLRRVLAGYAGDVIELAAGPQGKPHIADSAWSFNLSHCEDRALLAVAFDADVGVDLERERDDVDAAPIVAQYFAPQERGEFARQPIAKRQWWFFRQWVVKEAVVKAHGGGLSVAPDSFAVQFDDPYSARVIAADGDPGCHWRVTMLDAGPGWHAALAYDGPLRSVRFRERDDSRR